MPSALQRFAPFAFAFPLVFASSPWNRFAPRADGFDWQPCPGVNDSRITCSFYDIPLDYANEAAGNGKLWSSKFSPSTTTKGPIFINPGGPGGSGVDTIASLGETISNHTGGIYDIISWDPRGVGKFTIPNEITCYDSDADAISYWNNTLVYPPMDVRGNFSLQKDVDYLYSQVDIFDTKMKGLKDKCASTETGQLASYVGTVAAVRDMLSMADTIQGPGQPINYWGFSYGTVIGQYLVNMFPSRVGRVIIDGVVDPITWAADRPDLSWSHALESADAAFQGFAAGCELAGPSGCNISSPSVTGGKGVMEWFQDFADTVYDLHAAGQVNFTGMNVRAALYNGLYHPTAWSTLANGELFETFEQIQALNSSQLAGGGVQGSQKTNSASRRHSFLFKQLERSLLRRQDGNSTAISSNLMDAVTCGDSIDSTTTSKQVFDELLRVTQNVSGNFGPVGFPQSVHKCHLWPIRAVERYSGPWNATLTDPILVIGNKADPITPFKDAKSVADMLGDSAILIEQDGFGHSSLAERSACMQAITVDYFVNGKHPEGDDTSCGVDDTAELFPVDGGKGITALAIHNALTSSRTKRKIRF